jgi:hypothetical protein
MIIIRLNGGLANQMFQYAFGRAYSINNSLEFKLDISEYETYKLRNYSLNNLDVTADIADRKEINTMMGFNRVQNYFKRKLGLKIKVNNNYVKEKFYHFDESALLYNDNKYFDGYWQSYKYFQNIRDILLKELNVSNFNNPLLKSISDSESVSVHIRRGDYVSNAVTAEFHGILGIDYYKRAMEIIEDKVKKPVYFFFSDDINWVKENIHSNFESVYVENNKDYEDLIFMKRCSHNIIANSSFSWWGAWLNENSSKMVVAPQRWFADGTINTDDLIPPEWIRV